MVSFSKLKRQKNGGTGRSVQLVLDLVNILSVAYHIEVDSLEFDPPTDVYVRIFHTDLWVEDDSYTGLNKLSHLNLVDLLLDKINS